MFKVVDNEDGTTSIFCKNSGNFLCKIKSERKRNGPGRINLVETQFVSTTQSSLSSNWSLIQRISGSLTDESTQFEDEIEWKYRTRQSKCCLSPIPITVDGDQSEDYFDDCITQDEFAKCLNLISKTKLETEPIDSILAEYPLRLLSRSKAYRTLEDSPAEDLRDLKLPDDMPLTSNLGKKILHLNEDRNFVTEIKMMMSLKRYDDYCRIPFNTNKPSICNFPKLRCREKKTYPVTSLNKSSKHEANHFYTYGRLQRLDRMITLKTGLDARSRRLLHLCNRKKWSVRLMKLSQEEIDFWKDKQQEVMQISPDEESSLTKQPNLPSVETLRLNSVPTTSSSFLSLAEIYALLPPGTSLLKVRSKDPEPNDCSLEKLKKMCRKKCSVSLKDVTRYITKRKDGFFYVKNLPIRIPFYEEDLSLALWKKSVDERKMRKRNMSQVNQKAFSILKPIIKNGSMAGMSKFQNSNTSSCNAAKIASHFSERVTSPKVETNGLKEMMTGKKSLATGTKERMTSSQLCQTSSAELRLRNETAPLIDLTGDPSPLREKPEKIYNTSKWKFSCFGCGHRRFYLSNLFEQNTVEASIREHLIRKHGVPNPEYFLSKYIDRVSDCTVIEAFVDCKEKLDES